MLFIVALTAGGLTFIEKVIFCLDRLSDPVRNHQKGVESMPRVTCVWVRSVTKSGVGFGQIPAYITTDGKVCHPLPNPQPETFIPSHCAKLVAGGRVYACVIVPNGAGKRQRFRVERVLGEICEAVHFESYIGKQVVEKEPANAC